MPTESIETRLKCSWCDEDLETEEAEDPRTDETGDPMCDDCYRNEFQEECEGCGSYVDKDELGAIGGIIAVYDADEAGLHEGLYRVLNHPFYLQGLIGGGMIFSDCVAYLGPVTGELRRNTDGYPCAELCSECSRSIIPSTLVRAS